MPTKLPISFVSDSFPVFLASKDDARDERYNDTQGGILIFSPQKAIMGLPSLYYPWSDRLNKIMSTPVNDYNNEFISSVDVSVIYNVKDFLDQMDYAFLEYLDIEDILPTPYGTITLDFEYEDDAISIEIGESKIAFFTDFKNKKNIKLDGTYYIHKRIPDELREAFSRLMK